MTLVMEARALLVAPCSLVFVRSEATKAAVPCMASDALKEVGFLKHLHASNQCCIWGTAPRSSPDELSAAESWTSCSNGRWGHKYAIMAVRCERVRACCRNAHACICGTDVTSNRAHLVDQHAALRLIVTDGA